MAQVLGAGDLPESPGTRCVGEVGPSPLTPPTILYYSGLIGTHLRHTVARDAV